MEDGHNFLMRLRTKRYLLLGIVIFVFIFVLFLLLSIQSAREKSPDKETRNRVSTGPSLSQNSSQSPPQVSFSTYDNKAPLPTVPPQVNGYTLKANYSVEEAKELGKKLGITETKVPDDRFVILYNMSDMNSRGILTFDRVTGGISFQSYGVHRPKDTSDGVSLKDTPGVRNQESGKDTSGVAEGLLRGGGTKEALAQQFLTELNLSDPTISCPITYERKGLTGVTYVECHRDWSLVGLPILNTIGILNIPENKSLSSLAIGQTDTYSPDDPSITNVSFTPGRWPTRPAEPWRSGDGLLPGDTTGKARPNDFNTITIGVTEDGRILSLESTMRKITETKQYSSSDLLTPEEALDQIINHKSFARRSLGEGGTFSLTIPAGSGSVDWSKVYPDNKASGKKAIITDYLLTFLENPGQAPQERLVPMYIIRGTAELSSGYTVRFMETVPALKSGLSFLNGTVAGASTSLLAQGQGSDDRSLKLGTFQPSITIPPQPTTPIIPTLPQTTTNPSQPPNISIPPQTLAQCNNDPLLSLGFLTKEVVLNVPGIGELKTIVLAYEGRFGTGNLHTYFFKSASFPVKDMDEVRQAFFKAVEEQYVISISRHIVKKQIQPKAAEEIFEIFRTVTEEISGLYASECLQSSDTSPGCVKIIEIGKSVANRIFTGLQQNQITMWAQQNNIFPPETIDEGFDWVFRITTYSGINLMNCYISGQSPSLYLYPEKEMEVKVSLGGPISYSYPSLSNNTWDVIAKPNGLLCHSGKRSASWRSSASRIPSAYDSGVVVNTPPQNDECTVSTSRLYYEYDKSQVSFTEPKEGFVVKSNEWEEFIRDTLAPQLGLTKIEEDDLVVDVRNALSSSSEGVSTTESRSTSIVLDSSVSRQTRSNSNFPYLKLSFAPRTELDEKLPVSISPRPDTFHRIHLLLTPLTDNPSISNPSLQKLSRDGFTAVEIGVTIKE